MLLYTFTLSCEVDNTAFLLVSSINYDYYNLTVTLTDTMHIISVYFYAW